MAKQSLASAYVQIIPSADGISGKLAEVMGGEAASAGKISGKSQDKGRGGGGHRQDAAERLYRRHCV
mgnify:CR=1 FL=1